jgi:amidophosphoribosyltransferase
MVAATNQQENQLCTACFTGKYPIELPAEDRLGKNLLERGSDKEIPIEVEVKASND